MGKSTSGPEMTDVAAMMKAIEALHTSHVEFRVRTSGAGVNGSMCIACVAAFELLPGSNLPREVMVEHVWPSNAGRTFAALCYNLLWQLDYAIQREYQQAPLPDA